MPQIPFAEKTKESLLEIVRLSGIIPFEEAERMSQSELAERLAELTENELPVAEKTPVTKPVTKEKKSTSLEDGKPAQRKRGRPRKNSGVVTAIADSGAVSGEKAGGMEKVGEGEARESVSLTATSELEPTTELTYERSNVPTTSTADEAAPQKSTNIASSETRRRGRPRKTAADSTAARTELNPGNIQIEGQTDGRSERAGRLKAKSGLTDEAIVNDLISLPSASDSNIPDMTEVTGTANPTSPKKLTTSETAPASTASGFKNDRFSRPKNERYKKNRQGSSVNARADSSELTGSAPGASYATPATAATSSLTTPDQDLSDQVSPDQVSLEQVSTEPPKTGKATAAGTASPLATAVKDESPASADTAALPNSESTRPAGTSTPASSNPTVTDKPARDTYYVEEKTAVGVLEIMADGYGFLRSENFLPSNKDVFVPAQFIRRFNMRPGDLVAGPIRTQRDNDRNQALFYVRSINNAAPDKSIRRPRFDKLTPIYPNERYRLETKREELSTRIIDLIAPIGKGQRGMIVSPPKAGKTILLQKIANSISTNNPEVKLMVLLIDERPEEVTDMQRSIQGEVAYSTFDKTPENHVRIAELVLERAMRLVELGEDVVILLDSITRLARAYNLTINPTGRTLSGGLDPGALYGPKRFFGAARNIENGGSLTIIATSLIDTGSRMDEVIFEEFKGTGNMEVYLDRKLSEKRIFPAIDINRSGTRREELLLSPKELDAVWSIRKAFGQLDNANVTEMIINLLLRTNGNDHFVSSVNVSFNDKALFESMRMNKPSGNNT